MKNKPSNIFSYFVGRALARQEEQAATLNKTIRQNLEWLGYEE